jgi:hypothetical protein
MNFLYLISNIHAEYWTSPSSPVKQKIFCNSTKIWWICPWHMTLIPQIFVLNVNDNLSYFWHTNRQIKKRTTSQTPRNAFLADPELNWKVHRRQEVCLIFSYQASITIKTGRTLHNTKSHTILQRLVANLLEYSLSMQVCNYVIL